MNDRIDPLDETLARGLSALAPSDLDLDPDRALGALRPALRRARMRRRVAASTTALGVFAAVVAGAVVLQQHPSSHVEIRGGGGGGAPTVSTPRHTPRTTPKHPAPTTSTTTPAGHVVPPAPTPGQKHPTAGSGPVAVHPTPGQGPGPAPTSPRPTETTTPRHDRGSTTTVPPTAPAPATHTYAATGGHVTVRFAGGRLTLISDVAEPGYTAEIHKNAPDEIEVRFSNGGHESRIRIRVQDGVLQPEITEN